MSAPEAPREGQPEAAAPGPEQAPAEAPEAARVQALEAELAQLNSNYVRLAADFENYRRRRVQESEEQARYGSAALLQALLPGLDNLARAVSHIAPDAKDGLTEGLRLTLKQLEEALASQGIRRIPSVGTPFDPRLHEAVLTAPAKDAEPGTVVAELLPGYQIHDRVVRAAQVSVAEAAPEAPAAGAAPGRRGKERSKGGGEGTPGDRLPN
ncbi:MAG: nucleotide exchange factor GrpE [Candidatus Dormibacteria bacterium]